MNRYETDDEQVQEIKEWWKKNGNSILSLILIVSIAWAGWTYYQTQKKNKATSASITFQILQAGMERGNFGDVAREGLKLIEEQPESPYAVGSAFLLAKFYLSKKEAPKAIEQFNWVVKHAQDASLKLVAQIRLAKVYTQQGKMEQAKSALDAAAQLSLGQAEKANLDYAFADYYLAQSKPKEAADYLKKVIANKAVNGDLSHLATLQLNDLAL